MKPSTITRRTLLAAAAVGTAAIALPIRPALALTNGLLHYTPPSGYVGDVHPFFKNGTMYMYYLATDGTYSPRLATTTDFLTWQNQSLSYTPPAPAQSYYVLGSFEDGSSYRSYFGNGTEMRGSMSADHLTWSDAGRTYDIPNSTGVYTAGARDPFVFWDPDASKYRMVSSAYRSNADWGIGTGIDVSVALTTSLTSALTSWGSQTDLIRFPNTGVPTANAEEPEVAQMFKLGSRWYLLSSIARQSVHYVGRTTYWVGNQNTAIDADNWASKTRLYLDGEDLAAGQVVLGLSGKTLFFGWIPQSATGNAWGGHLSLPREIYALADGSLATRLESAFGAAMLGTQLFPAAGSITTRSGTWSYGSNSAVHSGTAFGVARLPVTASRMDVQFDVALGTGTPRCGLLLGQNNYSPLGLEVTLDRSNNLLRLRYDSTGSGGWNEYSTTPVRPGDLDGTAHIRVVAESNMVELFVADRYSLAARVPTSFSSATIDLFAANGPATFTNIKVCNI